ncbi:MAG TPA: acyl-CoA dehydrogenase family protein [Methylomirabilota bacterium]|jgi:alkylation response protein AidB-like acyl-CoA dehydrogenase|nr:acyl-CoA dehydrogenase family protein [Methylomirabilota bacterium]
MELAYSKEDEAFRKEVRDWLKKNLPKKDKAISDLMPHDPERVKRAKEWQRKLYDAGYVAMSWPKEYGGQAADVMRQTIVNEELVLARAPGLIGASGLGMLGPTLIQFGTEEQKRRYLPKILTAEEIWCQGYSEPGAGSDLASLRTRADIVGDEFIVNGQKVWTSNAQFSDWMFCLVRTDPDAPKHRGISYILIDMKTPGITVRPLIQMTGDAGFNEVFFDNVRVPRANLVGELNQGWMVANATLFHERNMLGSTTRTQLMMQNLLRLAQSRQRYGRPASQDPVIRQRLADLLTRVEAMKYHSYRMLTTELRDKPHGVSAMVNKLVGTELNHDICALALEILGSYAPLNKGAAHVIDNGTWAYEFMFTLGLIIGGGTSQIQKNIISERGLGMPKSG